MLKYLLFKYSLLGCCGHTALISKLCFRARNWAATGAGLWRHRRDKPLSSHSLETLSSKKGQAKGKLKPNISTSITLTHYTVPCFPSGSEIHSHTLGTALVSFVQLHLKFAEGFRREEKCHVECLARQANKALLQCQCVFFLNRVQKWVINRLISFFFTNLTLFTSLFSLRAPKQNHPHLLYPQIILIFWRLFIQHFYVLVNMNFLNNQDYLDAM